MTQIKEIRIVVYLIHSKPNETEKKYLDGKYMIIAFGLIDFENSNFLFLGGAGQQNQEWIDGKNQVQNKNCRYIGLALWQLTNLGSTSVILFNFSAKFG